MQRTRIDWVAEQSKLLRGLAEEFTRTQPFAGLTIGTGIHLEAKTVALLLTLQAGGAKLVSTGNLNTTQADAVSQGGEVGDTVEESVLGEVINALLKDAGKKQERRPWSGKHRVRSPAAHAIHTVKRGETT